LAALPLPSTNRFVQELTSPTAEQVKSFFRETQALQLEIFLTTQELQTNGGADAANSFERICAVEARPSDSI